MRNIFSALKTGPPAQTVHSSKRPGSTSHGIIELLELEETFKGYLVQPPAMNRGTHR